MPKSFGGFSRIEDPSKASCVTRKIQTTLDLYTQEDSDDTRAAQGEFLTAAGMNATVH
jgi:hypothetical protein